MMTTTPAEIAVKGESHMGDLLRGVSDASLAARTTDVKLKARLRRADASARGAAAVACRGPHHDGST
jgi:hypothetical protein